MDPFIIIVIAFFILIIGMALGKWLTLNDLVYRVEMGGIRVNHRGKLYEIKLKESKGGKI